MGKEISHFIIHFLIFYVLTMIEDIVERFYRNFSSYMAILSKKSTKVSQVKIHKRDLT